ncbi:MAG: hypothetical protein ABIE42_10200 [Candidatus Eisenbacteria bacterium]
MKDTEERDVEGNLTDWARARDALEYNGCDCVSIEPDGCLACVCERAMRTERTRAERAEEDLAELREDLRLNSAMLARQTALARGAEEDLAVSSAGWNEARRDCDEARRIAGALSVFISGAEGAPFPAPEDASKALSWARKETS